MKARNLLIAGAWVACALAFSKGRSQAADDPIAIIVNPANPVSSVSIGELRPIFQTAKTSWGNGAGDAMPINLQKDSPLRQEFDHVVLGLDPDRVARYWQDRKIRGGARPPTMVLTTSAMLKVVAANIGAVGYVRAGEVNSSVKVVAQIADGKLSEP